MTTSYFVLPSPRAKGTEIKAIYWLWVIPKVKLSTYRNRMKNENKSFIGFRKRQGLKSRYEGRSDARGMKPKASSIGWRKYRRWRFQYIDRIWEKWNPKFHLAWKIRSWKFQNVETACKRSETYSLVRLGEIWGWKSDCIAPPMADFGLPQDPAKPHSNTIEDQTSWTNLHWITIEQHVNKLCWHYRECIYVTPYACILFINIPDHR